MNQFFWFIYKYLVYYVLDFIQLYYLRNYHLYSSYHV